VGIFDDAVKDGRHSQEQKAANAAANAAALRNALAMQTAWMNELAPPFADAAKKLPLSGALRIQYFSAPWWIVNIDVEGHIEQSILTGQKFAISRTGEWRYWHDMYRWQRQISPDRFNPKLTREDFERSLRMRLQNG